MTSPKDGDHEHIEKTTTPESIDDTVVMKTKPKTSESIDDTAAAVRDPELWTTTVAKQTDETIAKGVEAGAEPWQPPGRGDIDPHLRDLGPYTCQRELGRGGMGRVLEAFDPELRRQVAVKVMLEPSEVSPEQRRRFVAEAQITAQLQHPCIMPIYDINRRGDGTFFYVMKKVEGRTLREVIDALKAGDEETTRRWTRHRLLTAFVQVCEAMAYAHERGVLHRDIKPDNIMLGRFGEVLILDWGVAQLMRDETEQLRTEKIDRVSLAATCDGVVIGTPGHMSPEQARGKLHELDGRSDVWSLGDDLVRDLELGAGFHGHHPVRDHVQGDERGPRRPAQEVSPPEHSRRNRRGVHAGVGESARRSNEFGRAARGVGEGFSRGCKAKGACAGDRGRRGGPGHRGSVYPGAYR